jgi:hypothetical protein
MSDTISIAGLDKAEVLAALYNSARAQGLGLLHYKPEPMAAIEARELLKEQKYFDYLKGRVMKVRIDGDELSTRLYDRDNGFGAAEAAIAPLRK